MPEISTGATGLVGCGCASVATVWLCTSSRHGRRLRGCTARTPGFPAAAATGPETCQSASGPSARQALAQTRPPW